MASLWSSSDAAEWLSTLEGYGAALEGVGKARLLELDRRVCAVDSLDLQCRALGAACVCEDGRRPPRRLPHRHALQVVPRAAAAGPARF